MMPTRQYTEKELTQILDINLLLAIFKCFTEQLTAIQGRDKHLVKQKFNKLLKVAQSYEKEVDKSMEESQDESIEQIYDALMENILEGRDVALKSLLEELKSQK
jgi:hypothetical protein